jgi:hypothetical protein
VTALQEARQAQAAAEERLAAVRARHSRVNGIVGSLERLLQENHFSVRLARAFEIEDDRR